MTLRIAVRWTSINSYTLPLPLPFSVSVLLATRRHSEVQKRAQNFNKHPSCCCERADRTELSEIAVQRADDGYFISGGLVVYGMF